MEIGFCKTQFCRPGMMLRTLETSGRVLEKLDYTRMSGVCEQVDQFVGPEIHKPHERLGNWVPSHDIWEAEIGGLVSGSLWWPAWLNRIDEEDEEESQTATHWLLEWATSTQLWPFMVLDWNCYHNSRYVAAVLDRSCREWDPKQPGKLNTITRLFIILVLIASSSVFLSSHMKEISTIVIS